MISIKRVSINELDNLVRISYKDDKEGLEKYHIKPFELNEAVDCTMGMILNEAKTGELFYYKVLYEGKPIGYFVISEYALFSFCINIHFRKPKIILSWWDKMDKLFKGDYLTAVYGNNTRALNFLKRRGLVVISKDEKTNIVQLLKSK